MSSAHNSAEYKVQLTELSTLTNDHCGKYSIQLTVQTLHLGLQNVTLLHGDVIGAVTIATGAAAGGGDRRSRSSPGDVRERILDLAQVRRRALGGLGL